MKFAGINIQYQSDINHKDIIMEFPEWQSMPDTIGQFGCLLCATLNARNHYNKYEKQISLKELNSDMIKSNGYNYLYYKSMLNNNIELMKKACYLKEAYSILDVLDIILDIKLRIVNYKGIVDINKNNEYYLLNTKFKNTIYGHWSWLISKDGQTVIDSYDGKKRKYSKDRIKKITKIIF